MINFSDICIITDDVLKLVQFYVTVFNAEADGDEIHSTVVANGFGIAIYAKKAAEADMGFDFSEYWGSGNFTIGCNVDDVDYEYERLQKLNVRFVTSPKTYPWGARSFHFRDPDGNIICFRKI